jgi:hypothetical protein
MKCGINVQSSRSLVQSHIVIGVERVTGFVAAGLIVLGLAITTLAQGPPAGAGPPPVINPKAEDRVRQTSEARLRSAEMDVDTEAENKKHINAAIANMKQDFTRIQVLRNDIARSLIAKKLPDYSLISGQTAEINRRAVRLNVYMLAHAPEKEESTQEFALRDEEMTRVLVKLCKLIDSFTENPALKNAAMVDAREMGKAKEDKAKADADLLAIIKLSDSIHKKADNLRAP